MMNVSPPAGKIWSKNFVTYRRLWLDTFLDAFEADMRGNVLDIGGKRENKRGGFTPPEKLAQAWWYVNLDLSTNPNIFADASTLPLKTESLDVIICTEVLEHLEDPAGCVHEIYRVLRKSGMAFFSVPFMYPVHADPYDYQRFTADGLRRLFSSFQSMDIYPMGGYLGTLAMLMDIGLPGITGANVIKKFLRRGLGLLASQLYQADIKISHNQPVQWSKFTTGYFVKVTK